ncbi:MAG: ester cyclase [Anaerolineaceae bacterium]|nr:ester cyclase [Anaerolineaceae bacterium]
MTTEQNTATAKRVVEEVINNRNLDLLRQLAAPGAVEHAAPAGQRPNLESTKETLTNLFKAFPDLKYTVEFTVAEGDRVVQYATVNGTMKGSFNGMPASGKNATWTEIHITRFDNNGKVAELWANIDQWSMLQQLGFIPSR